MRQCWRREVGPNHLHRETAVASDEALGRFGALYEVARVGVQVALEVLFVLLSARHLHPGRCEARTERHL